MYLIGDHSRLVWSYPNLCLCVSHIAAALAGNGDSLLWHNISVMLLLG